MSERKGRKVNRHKSIQALVDEVIDIDADNTLSTPGKKRVKYVRAVSKFNTSLRDGRKNRNDESKHLKPSTLTRYTTDARNAITEHQWLHHSFLTVMDKLIAKYPIFEEELLAIKMAGDGMEKPLDETRKKWDSFFKKVVLHDIVKSKIQNIDVISTSWKKQIKDVAKNEDLSPWRSELLAVCDAEDNKVQLDKLIERLSLCNDLEFFKAIKHLKIDHEIMSILIVDTVIKHTKIKQSEFSLKEKNHSAKTMDYCQYMAVISRLLSPPSWLPNRWESLTLGLIMATGRRPIEIIKQGKYKKINKHSIEFSGTAKQRGGVDYSKKTDIYSLVPTELTLSAWDELRDLPRIKELNELEETKNLTVNELINNRVGVPLNELMNNIVKQFNWPEMNAKHGRALYAKICVMLFHRKDPRWKDKTEDVMISELLAHESPDSQMYYKNWNVDNLGVSWNEIKMPVRGSVLEELNNIDDVIKDADAKTKRPGSPRWNIHQKVKSLLKADPELTITNKFIRDNVGGGNATIGNYMELAKEALLVDFDLSIVMGKQISSLDFSGDKPVDLEFKPKQEKSYLPKFSFEKLDADEWRVCISSSDESFKCVVNAINMKEAGVKAWNEFKPQPKKLLWSVEIVFNKGAIIPIHSIEGIEADNKKEAEELAIKQVRNGGIQIPIKKVTTKQM